MKTITTVDQPGSTSLLEDDAFFAEYRDLLRNGCLHGKITAAVLADVKRPPDRLTSDWPQTG